MLLYLLVLQAFIACFDRKKNEKYIMSTLSLFSQRYHLLSGKHCHQYLWLLAKSYSA